MFEVSLIPIAESAEEFRKISRETGACLTALYEPAGVLREFSYMEEPLGRIRKIQCRLDEKTAQAMRMSITLENIYQQYQDSEKEIVNYCEETAAAARSRARFGYAAVDWVSQWIMAGGGSIGD